jgi:hypothetical protein
MGTTAAASGLDGDGDDGRGLGNGQHRSGGAGAGAGAGLAMGRMAQGRVSDAGPGGAEAGPVTRVQVALGLGQE